MFARGTSEWISRVNKKHKQLAELDLADSQKERLEKWVETEFVYSTLALEAPGVARAQIERIVSTASGATEATLDTALLASLLKMTSLAGEKGKETELTADLLLKLHTVPGEGFRTGAGDASRVMKPVPAEHLPALLESACRWYTAESFIELNPVEQASIVLLRLIDLQPFETANERTALVAASMYTVRAGLPPIIMKPEIAAGYRNALEEGARMNTKPMVETVAEAIEKSLGELIEIASIK